MYIAAACTALSIAQIFMFDVGFKSVMYLVLSIVAVTTKHPKVALEYYTLSILFIFTFANLFNLEYKANLIGDKSSMQIGCNYNNPEEIVEPTSVIGNESTQADVYNQLVDGSTMKIDDILDLASDFLGEGYLEPVSESLEWAKMIFWVDMVEDHMSILSF